MALFVLSCCILDFSVGVGAFVIGLSLISSLSAPEPKLKCTNVVRRPSSDHRPSVVNFPIFDIFSESAERNSTKRDRKQDLNGLYQVFIFHAEQKNKMAAMASDLLIHFRLLLWNRWTEFNETWQDARSQRLLPSLCFSHGWENLLAVSASDCLWHFRLFLWNRWAQFNETWQEARSQCPVPSLYFSGRWVNKNGRPDRSGKKVAHSTQVHDVCGPLGLLSLLQLYLEFRYFFFVNAILIIFEKLKLIVQMVCETLF